LSIDTYLKDIACKKSRYWIAKINYKGKAPSPLTPNHGKRRKGNSGTPLHSPHVTF